MTILVLGLVLFLGPHAFTRLRGPRAVLEARLGAMPFKGVYSLLSLLGFVLIIVGYGQYRAAGMIPIWEPPTGLRYLAWALTTPVFLLLIAAYIPGQIKARVGHPMLAAVKLWSLAHLLVNGDLGSIFLFGSFLAWAVFARMRLGKTERLAAPWILGDTIAVVAGLAAWAATLLWLHQALIGISAA